MRPRPRLRDDHDRARGRDLGAKPQPLVANAGIRRRVIQDHDDHGKRLIVRALGPSQRRPFDQDIKHGGNEDAICRRPQRFAQTGDGFEKVARRAQGDPQLGKGDSNAPTILTCATGGKALPDKSFRHLPVAAIAGNHPQVTQHEYEATPFTEAPEKPQALLTETARLVVVTEFVSNHTEVIECEGSPPRAVAPTKQCEAFLKQGDSSIGLLFSLMRLVRFGIGIEDLAEELEFLGVGHRLLDFLFGRLEVFGGKGWQTGYQVSPA